MRSSIGHQHYFAHSICNLGSLLSRKPADFIHHITSGDIEMGLPVCPSKQISGSRRVMSATSPLELLQMDLGAYS